MPATQRWKPPPRPWARTSSSLNLRQGYDTPVEEGGVMLSVGQRQLISFARALLADPRILILDEATSSVDTQTERIIQQALARCCKAAPPLSSPTACPPWSTPTGSWSSRMGRSSKQGTHSELLAQGGVYYQLYRTGFEE